MSKAGEVAQRFDRAARERAAAALHAPDAVAHARLEAWVEQGGFAVTTGQQPGLFTGPLYTIYKALSAARLAETLEGMLEKPVLPVFWIASEDHDWEEASQATIVSAGNELMHMRIPAPPGQLGRPLHRIRLGEELAAAVADLLAELPDTDFSRPYRELLQRAYVPGATLAESFRTALEALLAPFGVFLLDGADARVKEASRSILEDELKRADAHEGLLAERARALKAAGYEPQVPILPGGVNLFVEGPAGRERLYRDDGAFQLRHSGTRLRVEDLQRRLTEDAASVSPNVLLRPVVESAVLPTLSLVVGPGEAAYFAQIQPYFAAFGLQPPIAYPRFGVTVVESKIGKVLQKFGVDVEDLQRPFHEISAELTREELPEPVVRALAEVRSALGKGSADLADAVKSIDPTLGGPVQRARSVSLDAWADTEKKILQALRKENEVALAQLEKARLHLYPDGTPQERVLNVFYYLFRYGDAFLQEVSRRFVVELREGAPH